MEITFPSSAVGTKYRETQDFPHTHFPPAATIHRTETHHRTSRLTCPPHQPLNCRPEYWRKKLKKKNNFLKRLKQTPPTPRESREQFFLGTDSVETNQSKTYVVSSDKITPCGYLHAPTSLPCSTRVRLLSSTFPNTAQISIISHVYSRNPHQPFLPRVHSFSL